MAEYIFATIPATNPCEPCNAKVGDVWVIGGEKAERIVRCRDCKHAGIMRPLDWRTGKPSTVIEEWYCKWHSNAEGASDIDPDGFCKWGERREVDA